MESAHLLRSFDVSMATLRSGRAPKHAPNTALHAYYRFNNLFLSSNMTHFHDGTIFLKLFYHFCSSEWPRRKEHRKKGIHYCLDRASLRREIVAGAT